MYMMEDFLSPELEMLQAAPVKMALLGAPMVERGGSQVSLGSSRALALLTYLAMQRGAVTRETLTALLWPEASPSRARAGLRNALWLVRQQVGEDTIACCGGHVTFAGADVAAVDVHRFDAQMSTVRAHNHAGHSLCMACHAALVEAAQLYNDEFLRGFNLPDAPDFDAWQVWERRRLRDNYHWALGRLAAHHAARGEWDLAIGHAWRRVAEDRLDETAHVALIDLMARAGRRVDALRQYDTFAQLLHDELDVAPGPEISALVHAIRSGRGASPTMHAAASASPHPFRRTAVRTRTVTAAAEHPAWPLLYYE